MVHRIASSEQYNSSLIEIQTQFSFDDILDCNEVLDLYEEANAKAMKVVEKKR